MDEINNPKGGYTYLPVVFLGKKSPIFFDVYSVSSSEEWEQPKYDCLFSQIYQTQFKQNKHDHKVVFHLYQPSRFDNDFETGDIGIQFG